MGNVLQLPGRSSANALVAAKVRAEMGRVNVSQLRLSALTGIPHSTLNRRLKPAARRDSFSIEELDRIAHALGVPLTKFFTTTNHRPDGDDDGTARPKGFEPLTFWEGHGATVSSIFTHALDAGRAA